MTLLFYFYTQFSLLVPKKTRLVPELGSMWYQLYKGIRWLFGLIIIPNEA